ncbi:single-stranded DNA-binding protein [Phaeodactylibacter xiamenensis]|uniref:single-stranded DNA-binding protein n=1 Tax=Phaeodactylibacter xiamenensis TaxID=1524460 RepID=UPI003CCBA401
MVKVIRGIHFYKSNHKEEIMAINNTVELIGNIGSKLRMIDTEERSFGSVSIATTDSYKDKETEEWKDKETIWHELVVFSPSVIEQLKAFDKGARLKVIGTLSYRPFTVQLDGKTFDKKEVSIIVRSVEQAPLTKKG